MKKSIYLLMSVLLISFASCNDKDKINYIPKDQLPEKVHTFLQTYFGDNEFISATQELFYGGSNLAVNLKDVKIEFTPDYDWYLITLADGLPASAEGLIHENALKELKEREPGVKITQLHNRYGKEVDIYMSNQKLYSDIVGHEGNTLAELVMNPEELPQEMKDYISQYVYGGTRMSDHYSEYPKVQKFTGFKGDIYRLRLSLEAFVDFYENGNWFYVEDSGIYKFLNNKLLYAVPDAIVEALKTKGDNIVSKIRKINRFYDNKVYGLGWMYAFTLEDESFVLIDSDNNILEPPLEQVKEYIQKGFNPEKELQYEVNTNIGSAYFLRYGFVISGWGKEPIRMTTDAWGDMRDIRAGKISTREEDVTPLPRPVLEMLPHSIADYLDEHYPGLPVVNIWHSYSKKGDLPPEINVRMSVPNNLKTAVFDYFTGKFIEEYLMVQR